MDLLISLAKHIPDGQSTVLLCQSIDDLSSFSFSKEEKNYIQNSFDKDNKSVTINRYNQFVFVQKTDEKLEGNRLAAKALHSSICQEKIAHITVVDLSNQPKVAWAFTEGLALSNYQFLKYFTDKKENSLKEISLHSANGDEEINQLNAVIEGTYVAKDLVNEPFSYLTAMQYSQDIEKMGEEAGFKVEVLHKKKN